MNASATRLILSSQSTELLLNPDFRIIENKLFSTNLSPMSHNMTALNKPSNTKLEIEGI